MDKIQVGSPFECYGISIQIEKEVIIDGNGEPIVSQEGKTEYRSGFKVGGGIDQDHTKSPQQYKDNGIYVTRIQENSPASRSGLKINDKILQVNGYDFTLITHKKAIDYLKRGKTLFMLVQRDP